jgi:hypothetical protein
VGAIAIRCFDHRLTWSAPDTKITGCVEAEGMLRREYRKGWGV